MKERQIFTLLCRQIQSHEFKNAFNTQANKQSSVSIIFRLNPLSVVNYQKLHNEVFALNDQKQQFDLLNPAKNILKFEKIDALLQNEQFFVQNNAQQNIQLIFIQRQINPKDIHSGQLAFPGGHVDLQENDFQAALREVHEELGINLNDPLKNIYFGKLPNSFYVRKTKKGENLFINVHFFLTFEQNIQFNLSEQEVADVKWVEFDEFLFPKDNNIILYKYLAVPSIIMALPKILQKQAQNSLKYYEYSNNPAFNVGMKSPLWGLTYYVVIYVMTMLVFANKSFNSGFDFSQMKKIINSSHKIDLIFKKNYKFGYVINYFSQKWYQKNRVQQFSYNNLIQKSEFKQHLPYLILFIVAYFSLFGLPRL